MKLREVTECSLTVYTDASGFGYGGYIEEHKDHEAFGQWSCSEMKESSTWRELEAVVRVLHGYENCLEGQSVQWYTDNKNVVTIIQKGSKKDSLQSKAIEIFNTCKQRNISIKPVWVKRQENKRADELSRVSDSDDWEVKQLIFHYVEKKVGSTQF